MFHPMSKSLTKIVWTVGAMAMPWLALADQFQLPEGDPWDAGRISDLLHFIANWLIGIGVVGAVICFVLAGIMYFTAGFNAKGVEKGKELFKNAIWGTLIILAVGVIINTIAVIVKGEFFSGFYP